MHGGKLTFDERSVVLRVFSQEAWKRSHSAEFEGFYQKSICLTQSTLEPYVVQIWSRNTPKTGPKETVVLHRVVEYYEDCADASLRESGGGEEEQSPFLKPA